MRAWARPAHFRPAAPRGRPDPARQCASAVVALEQAQPAAPPACGAARWCARSVPVEWACAAALAAAVGEVRRKRRYSARWLRCVDRKAVTAAPESRRFGPRRHRSQAADAARFHHPRADEAAGRATGAFLPEQRVWGQAMLEERLLRADAARSRRQAAMAEWPQKSRWLAPLAAQPQLGAAADERVRAPVALRIEEQLCARVARRRLQRHNGRLRSRVRARCGR